MAGTVGILVNTLSLANTKVLLNTIKEKIKEAGKKHYIFVVGSPMLPSWQILRVLISGVF